jgi:hypothetical protein
VPIHYFQDDNGYLVYKNTKTGAFVHVWDGDLANAVDICEDWYENQRSPCHRLINNDFSFRNLRGVLRELNRAVELADATSAEIDGDDYLDLLTTVEDLEGIIDRIIAIADQR